jgi:hypothetical protein
METESLSGVRRQQYSPLAMQVKATKFTANLRNIRINSDVRTNSLDTMGVVLGKQQPLS